MHHLLNTLFVQTQGTYLRLDHETVRVEVEGKTQLQVPLHHLEGIAVFGNVLLSPFLIFKCAEDGRSVVWFDRDGEFKGRFSGPVSGNVLLRRAQFRAAEDSGHSLELARCFVKAKLKNTRSVLLRAARERGRSPRLQAAIEAHEAALRRLSRAEDLDEVRGLEGKAGAAYFVAFSELILVQEFGFDSRIKRPPRDPVNALLSFVYTLLANDCVSALEGVGLDPQFGFLHTLRPGRPALALDLMEEFRCWWADRLVLALLNRRQLTLKDFEQRPGGAVYLAEGGRRTVITAYQKRKQEMVEHPLLKRHVPVGLLPHVQARLLARYLRGDVANYAPFVGR